MGKYLLGLLTLVCNLLVYKDECIYTVCQESADACYVYDASGTFYLEEDDNFTKLINSAGLSARPALTYMPIDEEYSLEEELPHCYKASFREACAFLTAMTKQGFDLETVYRDSCYLDILLQSSTVNVRCIVTSDGHVRIYTENPADFLQISSYISGEIKE